MITLFKFIVFIHVVSAVVWLGCAFVLQLMQWQTRYAGRQQLLAQLERENKMAKIFGPAAGLTLLSGIVAVSVGNPSFGQFWVITALTAVAATVVFGALFVGRAMKTLQVRLADPKFSDEQVELTLDRTNRLANVNLSILAFILFDMVIRPARANKTFIIISVVYFLLAIIFIFARSGKRPVTA